MKMNRTSAAAAVIAAGLVASLGALAPATVNADELTPQLPPPPSPPMPRIPPLTLLTTLSPMLTSRPAMTLPSPQSPPLP